MQIISDTRGIVLKFSSLGDLDLVIRQLEGLKEWTEKENIDPPHLYCVFNENMPAEDALEYLDEIKEGKYKIAVEFSAGDKT